ncbi:MAG TPA: formate dehydrogenase accessory sulfurtransferase FdhD [Ferruginibacter sp.]|nr:formate dehydrogenase accessory sulfurtransferase FdhD [Ferruginibacter sp.]
MLPRSISISSAQVAVPVKKITEQTITDTTDWLSVEEPLEIQLTVGPAAERQTKSISVTMRTPGADADLALGFLFTEGILRSIDEVQEVVQPSCNVIQIQLQHHVTPRLSSAERNFYTTSSCGVCGKSSIDAIRTVSPFATHPRKPIELSAAQLMALPELLQQAQEAFALTGGIHASGLFSLQNELILLREDVGRHNALDKLIGAALQQQQLPLQDTILLLSGRASFELLQKATMAGIPLVVSIGAPSSLAVALAMETDTSLIGFLKSNRLNIYHASKHLLLTH